MPLFDIALPKPLVKALVGSKGKGKGKGKGNKVACDKRRPSWVRLGRSMAGPFGAKGKLQAQEKSRLPERSSGAGTLRRVSSSRCLRLEQAVDEPNCENHGDVDQRHELTRWRTPMPHGAASPREARYSLSAADDCDFDEVSPRPDSSLSFGGHASSEGSDSFDYIATPTEGDTTPINNLSRSPSYKANEGYHLYSPFQSRAPSPLAQQPSPTVVYPYTLRLVPQCQDRAPHDGYFDDVLSNLPSFRPLHPAMAFDDEGE